MHFGFSFKMMNLFSMKKQNGFVYRQPKKQRRVSAVSPKYSPSALWMESRVLRHLFLPDLFPPNLVLGKSGRFIVAFRQHNMSLPCAPSISKIGGIRIVSAVAAAIPPFFQRMNWLSTVNPAATWYSPGFLPPSSSPLKRKTSFCWPVPTGLSVECTAYWPDLSNREKHLKTV